MNIGEKIRQARTDAGVSQAELAERIGVYQKDICRWETGARTPSLEAFTKICRALNVSADALLELGYSKVTENEYDSYSCTECGYNAVHYYDDICPKCGRKLDWSILECQ